MALESAIENLVCEKAKKAGWFCRKLQWAARRGGCDRFFAKDGRVVLMEFKKPGGALSANQEKELAALTAAGVECYVVDNPLTAYRILGIER